MTTLRYPAPLPGSWLHFLHGNVPGHQLDWILRPEAVPEALEPFHVQHLHGLIHSRDVAHSADVVLTFGNLSTRDTRYRAGHGALAILLHVRILDSADHAGRPSPRFVHAMVQIDRDFTAERLADAAGQLRARLTSPMGEGRLREIDRWYSLYQEAMGRDLEEARAILLAYLGAVGPFADLPVASPGPIWRPQTGATLPDSMDVFCEDASAQAQKLARMASLAAELFRSTVRWSDVSTARRSQTGGGSDLEIQFLSDPSEIPQGGNPPLYLKDLPAAGDDLVAAILPVTRSDRGAAGTPENRPPPAPVVPKGRALALVSARTTAPPATEAPEPASLRSVAVDASSRPPHPPNPVHPGPAPPDVANPDRQGLNRHFRITIPLLILGSFLLVTAVVVPFHRQHQGRGEVLEGAPSNDNLATTAASSPAAEPKAQESVIPVAPKASVHPAVKPKRPPKLPPPIAPPPEAIPIPPPPAAHISARGTQGGFEMELIDADGAHHRIIENLDLAPGTYTFHYFARDESHGDDGVPMNLTDGCTYTASCRPRLGCTLAGPVTP